jgi:hypothetical protein
MNFFNTLSSRLVGGLDTTSLSYINNLELTTTLDMCGNDLIDLSNAVYGSKAYGMNAYDANSSFLVVHNSSNNLPLKTSDFALNPFSGFSVYMKYKVRDNGLYTVFSQYALDNPIVKLTSSHTDVEAGDTFEITVFQKGYAVVSYAITGVTSAQLGGASLTGTVSDMYTVLPFTLQSSASGPIVFTADGKSVSVTITYDLFANAKHYFDANDATSVILESGTDNVLSWTNQNDSNVSINYVTTNKPTYVTAAYKYISLVNSGLKLSDSSVSSSHNLTVFQAFRIENSQNDGLHSTVCMFGNDFDDNGAFQFLRLATSKELRIYYQGSTTTVWGSGNWATGYILDKNETYIIAYIFEETDSTKFNISLRITNSSNTTIWGPYEIDRGTNPLLKDNMYLCNWSKTGSYNRSLDANIYEYLMFEQSLTTEEIQLVETELIDKYYST